MSRGRVPFYKQTLDFSCGPACLLMALKAHDAATPHTFQLELDLWREATIGAVPATMPQGLALAAWRRGFSARFIVSSTRPPFESRIRARMLAGAWSEALDRVWDDLWSRTRDAGVPHEVRPVTVDDVASALAQGEVAIFLTDAADFGDPDHVPHWVVAGERAGKDFVIHNPLDDGPAKSVLDPDALAKVLHYETDQALVCIGAKR